MLSFRPMADNEKLYVKQFYKCYVQFAIEVEHKEDLKETLEKLKRATAGLYIKSDGFNFLDNHKDEDAITVHRIPKEIEDLTECCDWIYNTYTPDVEYSLASIAADDHRIVINSSHALTDGGYFVNLLKDLQDPSKEDRFLRKAPIPRDLRTDLLKIEFDEFLKNRSNYMKKLPTYQQNNLTYLTSQEVVNLPDSYNLVQQKCKTHLNYSEFSPYIYDKSRNRISHMSEYLWTGLCMAVNAKNGQYGSIGLGSCIDFRRLLPNDRVNSSFGCAFTDFSISVKNANPRMTIADICAEFRNSFNNLKKNGWFYKEYLSPFQFQRKNFEVSHVSNVGPMKFRSPYKDFYVQCMQKEGGLREMLQTTCYSKIKEDANKNDLVLQMRYSPRSLSRKNAKDIFDTYVYFLKNVNPAKKSGDVLDELIHFQRSLE